MGEGGEGGIDLPTHIAPDMGFFLKRKPNLLRGAMLVEGRVGYCGWTTSTSRHFDTLRNPYLLAFMVESSEPRFLRWCRISSIHSRVGGGINLPFSAPSFDQGGKNGGDARIHLPFSDTGLDRTGECSPFCGTFDFVWYSGCMSGVSKQRTKLNRPVVFKGTPFLWSTF